jgi:membrane associated rhomboid family serine protease
MSLREQAEEPIGQERAVPWHAYLPSGLLAIGMWIAWIFHLPLGGMTEWAVSATVLKAGHVETIALHMLAHGGLAHILMNSIVLVQLGGPLVVRLGPPPQSWLRFAIAFILGGLSGMIVYLAIHPTSTTPMLGASGAIYGLLGLLIRSPTSDAPLMPIRSPEMRAEFVAFAKDNLLLILLLTVPALLAGRSGGVAWEAHLGGFLFGLLAAPKLLPEPSSFSQPMGSSAT